MGFMCGTEMAYPDGKQRDGLEDGGRDGCNARGMAATHAATSTGNGVASGE
jgi:hypothetical protein